MTTGSRAAERSVVQRLFRDKNETLALLFKIVFNDFGPQPEGPT